MIRISERNAKQKNFFLISFPSESIFGERQSYIISLRCYINANVIETFFVSLRQNSEDIKMSKQMKESIKPSTNEDL